MPIRKTITVLASLVVLAMSAACTLQGGSGTAEAGSGSIKKVDSLDGVTIKVGSKEFDEQLILGQIAILALQAAGAETQDKTNITGTDNVRKALESGEIDLYWEYTGTAWASFLEQTKREPDPEQLFEKVKTMDADNDIVWWDRAPGNDTYAIAGNGDAVKQNSIKSLSDYAQLAKTNPEQASMCMGSEFKSRSDGFPGIEKWYKFELPQQYQHEVNDAVVFPTVGKGKTCNFGSVASTDGRVAAQHLVVLEDDKSFWPIYNPAISIRSDVAKEHPELEKVFEPVAKALDTETLTNLNKQVSVDGSDPAKVATDWMKKEGFIG